MKLSDWGARLASDPFRIALLLILLSVVIVGTWHISWLHRQQNRYDIRVTDHGAVLILDHQLHVVHAGAGLFNDEKPVVWHTSPLPQ